MDLQEHDVLAGDAGFGVPDLTPAKDSDGEKSAPVALLPADERRLAVVVITRNEARHIAQCLGRVLAAAEPFADTQIVVVDADSEDETAQIAATFSVEVYRYRSGTRTAAAGRAIGTQLVRARYILFVDGDSLLEAAWLPRAIQVLDEHPRAAVVYGQRQEVFEGVDHDFHTGVPSDPGLGGTALYRVSALTAAGGFHPHLRAEEEGELRARIEARGYSIHELPDLMFTHCTVPKDSWRGHFHRIRRGMPFGCGQVLRASLRDGLFRHHARRLNRILIAAGYLLAGLVFALLIAAGAPGWIAETWIGIGLLAFAVLWYRRGRFRSASYIVSDWLLGALGLAIGFFSPLRARDDFDPVVERAQRRAPEPAANLAVSWKPVR